MKILLYDVIQISDAEKELKTPALADRFMYNGVFTINFPYPVYIDSIGIGYTDSPAFKITFYSAGEQALNNLFSKNTDSDFEMLYDNGRPHDKDDEYYLNFNTEGDYSIKHIPEREELLQYDENGLYKVKPVIASAIKIECGGTYIGRLGAGRGVHLGTAIAKEPGYNSTADTRRTLSGQVISGAGGYSYRTVGLDTRYKTGGTAMTEIKSAFDTQIALSYPYFLLFEDERRRLPFYRLYAKDKNHQQLVFESGTTHYLFSRKFDFEECF